MLTYSRNGHFTSHLSVWGTNEAYPYKNYGKQYGGSLKKLKIELPYDPGIPLLGMYLEKILIGKDTCTPMFIEALFTRAKTWKRPKCPLTDKWMKTTWSTCICVYMHIYTYICIPFAANWMDLEIIIQASLVDQTEKNLPAMQEPRVWSLGWEDTLKNGRVNQSSILAWSIPWTEQAGGLQPMGLQTGRDNWDD